jgi:integrase/recombinase XerD
MRRRRKSVEVKVVFDRKHTATKSTAKNRKRGPVSVEVYYDRKRVYLSTGVKVYSDQFRMGRICNHGQQGTLNERVSILVSRIENYINDIYKQEGSLNLDKLKEYINRSYIGDNNSFLAFMENSIASRNIADSTRNSHNSVLRVLREWGHIKSFEDVTEDNVKAWHMESVKAAKKADFAVNHDRILRIYIHEAIIKGLVKQDPYKYWKVPSYTPSSTHRSISLDELRKIEAVVTKNRNESTAKDLFLFQANTGLAYVDTQSFDLEELKRNVGRIAYQNKRVKTGECFYVPINDKAKSILKKHDGRPPKLNITIYNRCLKRIAKAAGVDLPLSSHWARHTFAMICLNNGMPIEVLAKILGHSNIATTQIYAHMQKDAIDASFDAVMKKINSK